MGSPGNGRRLICVGPDDVGDPPMPELEAYERDVAAEVRQRLGARAGLINPIVGTVFPNFSLLRGTSRTFKVWQPHGPDRTEVRSFVFMDKAAPPQVKRVVRLAGIRGFSPSGSSEQDDMDNWQECTETCRGVMSRRMPLNTQMGLGRDRFDPALGAWVSDYRFSESNRRQFYRRWADLIGGADWRSLTTPAVRESRYA